jgi:hypothetical protein
MSLSGKLGGLRSESGQASFEQVFWRAEKNTRVILRPQTPLSYPSQKNTVQNDVTLIHSENPSEKKRCELQNKATLVSMYGKL